MKKILKSRIFSFILGLIVMASIVGVYAINANEITYKDTTVEEAIDDLYDKTRPTLLWTNPNPNTNFAAQTINLDLSEYQYIVIITIQSTSIDSKPRASSILPVGTGNINIGLGISEDRHSRYAITSETGIIFSDAHYGTATYNDRCIPYKIYGIKGEIGIDIGLSE